MPGRKSFTKYTNFNWNFAIGLVGIVALGAILSLINISAGIGEDTDSYRIVDAAMQFGSLGYEPSRSWGFPAYELAVYPIIYYFGTSSAKLYSLFFYLASCALLYSMLWTFNKDACISFLASASFALLPVSIISGNSIIETSQAMFFCVFGIFLYQRFLGSRKFIQLLIALALIGIASATRPEYAIVGISIILVVSIGKPLSLLRTLMISAMFVLLFVSPFAIYGHLTISSKVLMPDPLVRKAVRAVFGYLGLLGLPVVSVLVTYSIIRWHSIRRDWRALRENHFAAIGAICLVFASIRFVLLPDELEYVYLLVPLLVLSLTKHVKSRFFFLLLAVASLIPNLIQIHIFDRDAKHKVIVNVGLSAGAIFQDRRYRLLNEYRSKELPILQKRVASIYGHDDFVATVSRTEGDLVIIPAESLRYYHPDRLDGEQNKAFSSLTVIVYPLPSNRGWRQFLRFQEWQSLQEGDFRRVSELPY